jgi:uncharacterized protein (TIGR00266 family)
MKYEILHQPSYALAKLNLEKDESIQTESGAMVSMSSNVTVETGLQKGGIWGALKRTVLGGESFFTNTFTAKDDVGEITLAPVLSGDIYVQEMKSVAMLVQSGSYLAGSKELDVDTKWGGAKTFFSGEGLFMLRVSGAGVLFMSSYGAIHEVNLVEGQKYVIDTGHIVAFEENMNYAVKKVGDWKSTFLSGEGLVVEITGPGKVLLQTRSFESFLNFLIPKLPKPTNSSN